MNGRCVGTGDLLAVAQADVYPPYPHPVYCSVPSVGRGLLWIKAKQAFSYLIHWYHSLHSVRVSEQSLLNSSPSQNRT